MYAFFGTSFYGNLYGIEVCDITCEPLNYTDGFISTMASGFENFVQYVKKKVIDLSFYSILIDHDNIDDVIILVNNISALERLSFGSVTNSAIEKFCYLISTKSIKEIRIWRCSPHIIDTSRILESVNTNSNITSMWICNDDTNCNFGYNQHLTKLRIDIYEYYADKLNTDELDILGILEKFSNWTALKKLDIISSGSILCKIYLNGEHIQRYDMYNDHVRTNKIGKVLNSIIELDVYSFVDQINFLENFKNNDSLKKLVVNDTMCFSQSVIREIFSILSTNTNIVEICILEIREQNIIELVAELIKTNNTIKHIIMTGIPQTLKKVKNIRNYLANNYSIISLVYNLENYPGTDEFLERNKKCEQEFRFKRVKAIIQ